MEAFNFSTCEPFWNKDCFLDIKESLIFLLLPSSPNNNQHFISVFKIMRVQIPAVANNNYIFCITSRGLNLGRRDFTGTNSASTKRVS